MNLYSIPTLINLIFTLGLAFLVLYQGLSHLANKAFALAICSVSIMEFGNLMALNSLYPLQLLFWARISLIGCCLIPANWSLFSVVFAKSDYAIIAKKFKLILLIIYLLSFSFLIFIPSDFYHPLPGLFTCVRHAISTHGSKPIPQFLPPAAYPVTALSRFA